MGKILKFKLFYLLFFLTVKAFSQESAPGIIITCPGHDKDAHTHIPTAPPSTLRRTAQTATFIVEYIGFTDEAREAFQYAINIWESRISSPVPIRVRASWIALDEGVLGSAGATRVFRNFDGAPRLNTWYPVALAEKLARTDLNDPMDADIVANFNSNGRWYLGTDGKAPPRTTDFVTVVLHEIAHGLGFISSMEVENNQGSWGISNWPLTFDTFIQNNNGQHLANTSQYPNPSAALRNQLTSDNLFFHGPVINERLTESPKLFAPAPYDEGSSISHLDEQAYPPGNINSLMTPRIGTAEVIHEPGPMLMDIFAEMGWESTFIDVTGNKDTEDPTKPITIKTKIYSENEIIPESLVLHYSSNGFVTSSQIQMQATSNANEYEATIPAPLVATSISYYVRVNDLFSREFVTPINAPNGFHQINIGPDFIPPTISHEPIEVAFVNEADIPISAFVSDNVGIRDVTVEYRLNNVQQVPFQLNHAGNDVYEGNFTFQAGQLQVGDEISYRIVARDLARNINTAASPTQGHYSFRIRDEIQPRLSYTNDFNTPTDDFTGNGFSIVTPPQFNNPAIHSRHPYEDDSNYTYQLLIPIIVESRDAIMTFREIALVEPGGPDSEFGDSEFFDYVVVEGSKDGGATWLPLAPGYDARKHPEWLSHYNSNIRGENSLATGNSSLYKSTSINLLNTFAPGDVILIRFRLFADQSAFGWGWAIDDLSIQGVLRPLQNELVLRPNPTSGQVFVEIPLHADTQQADVRVFNSQGKEVYFDRLLNPNPRFIKEINLSGMAPGVYIVMVDSDGQKTSKRLILID